MKHLIIDGLNFMHRARGGMQIGPRPVTFNFFRNLRAIVGQFNPDRVWFVLEGFPKERYNILESYKASRVVDKEVDPKRYSELEKFANQKREILMLMYGRFPVTLVRHPDWECDDTIYNLARKLHREDVTIATNDGDFTQILNEFATVKLYNPMKKEYVQPQPYDYVTWKALKGDPSDSIKGVPGCGEVTATKLSHDSTALQRYLNEVDGRRETYERNRELIKFHTFTEAELEDVEYGMAAPDWDSVKRQFDEWEFKSITRDGTWQKFIGTFDPLVGRIGR